MSTARRRALSAVLSALAGGGLTAAALGATAPGVALAEQSPPTESIAVPEAPASTTTTPTTTSSTTTTTTAPTSTAPTTTTPTQTVQVKAPPPPAVKVKHRQKTTKGAGGTTAPAPGAKAKAKKTPPGTPALPAGASNVAVSPQMIAAQASALASAQASVQALGFYRIPLFLLPVYKAAAIQYGVPWQILAAINEIETNYGSDQSVSTAGAVGWMQFMPSTWLQYGVDALDAGYADPYNPVDAIFAAARYLRAAGAATDLHAAILAYNHSEEYVSSVLLRAKLISTYPRSVIATLTGLVDGRLPVTGKRLDWSPVPASVPAPAAASSATAGATAVAPSAAASGVGKSAAKAGTPGTTAAVSPAAAAAKAARAHPLRLATLSGAPNAHVVAVENGRIVQIGSSRALGRYIVLRDIYGDVFTYAGLGSIAPTYVAPKQSAQVSLPLVEAAAKHDPTPSQAASAGVQTPLTLQVKAKSKSPSHAQGGHAVAAGAGEELGPGASKVRLFAHPGNPDALAAAVANRAARARAERASTRLPLRRGAVVTSGTVLGTVSASAGATTGHLRFAIRPAGDPSTIDPGPVLSNWSQLQAALHPQGAKAQNALFGATAADVFLLSKRELQRTVLSDPGISVYACGRHDITAGTIDKRVLALLAFLSRSGLHPTVSALHCGQRPVRDSGAASAAARGDAVEISAVNGHAIAGHQGAGTITDLTIRTLLTLPAEFMPAKILSLMRYPGAKATKSSPAYGNRIHIEFAPAAATVKPAVTQPVTSAPTGAKGSAAAAAGSSPVPAASPLVPVSPLNADQWNQLVTRIGALPAPSIRRTPSSSALADPKKPNAHP